MEKIYEKLEGLMKNYETLALSCFSDKKVERETLSVLMLPMKESEQVLIENWMVKLFDEKELTFKDDEEYTFVYDEVLGFLLHYDFYEMQLGEFFNTYEPHGCDYDKADFILNHYLRFLLTGTIPSHESFEKKQKDFYKPSYNHPEKWMEFVSSCKYLLIGKPSFYLKRYQELVSHYTTGVAEKKEAILKMVSEHPYYVDTEEKEYETIHFLASGEETATIKINAVGEYRVSFYIPEMKGIRMLDAIRNKMEFDMPDWVQALKSSLLN